MKVAVLMGGGTSEHEILSWIAPRELVTFDIARSGLLAAPPGATPSLTEIPTYRSARYQVLNGVPDALRERGALGFVATALRTP